MGIEMSAVLHFPGAIWATVVLAGVVCICRGLAILERRRPLTGSLIERLIGGALGLLFLAGTGICALKLQRFMAPSNALLLVTPLVLMAAFSLWLTYRAMLAPRERAVSTLRSLAAMAFR